MLFSPLLSNQEQKVESREMGKGKSPIIGLADTGPEICQFVKGEGLYLGTWEPMDKKGKSLNKIFDLYAAPQDITDERGEKLLLNFNETVVHVAGLNKWWSYDGVGLVNDEAIIQAVRKDPKELEKWFLPPWDVLENHLYQNRDKGDLKNTFDKRSVGHAPLYLSCTEHPGRLSVVRCMDFMRRLDDDYKTKDGDDRGLIRPIRAVLRP